MYILATRGACVPPTTSITPLRPAQVNNSLGQPTTIVCSMDTRTFPNNERSNGVKLFSVGGKIQEADDGFICSEVLEAHRRLQ